MPMSFAIKDLSRQDFLSENTDLRLFPPEKNRSREGDDVVQLAWGPNWRGKASQRGTIVSDSPRGPAR